MWYVMCVYVCECELCGVLYVCVYCVVCSTSMEVTGIHMATLAVLDNVEDLPSGFPGMQEDQVYRG